MLPLQLVVQLLLWSTLSPNGPFTGEGRKQERPGGAAKNSKKKSPSLGMKRQAPGGNEWHPGPLLIVPFSVPPIVIYLILLDDLYQVKLGGGCYDGCSVLYLPLY